MPAVDNVFPRRRKMTLVRAVKNKMSRATSSTELNNNNDNSNSRETSARQHRSTYPTCLRSSQLPSRDSQSRSASSLDAFTRNNSADVLGSTMNALPLTVQAPRRGSLQEALPTPDFYKRFPRALGPLANILIATPEEYKMFCLTARAIKVVARPEERNVSKDRLSPEDIARGGFFVYQPNTDAPRFFLLHEKSVDVYGSSSYLRR